MFRIEGNPGMFTGRWAVVRGDTPNVIRIHDFTTVDRIETTIEEHLEILNALLAGRQDAAAALMRVHIERSAEVVERRVGELLARMFEEERP